MPLPYIIVWSACIHNINFCHNVPQQGRNVEYKGSFHFGDEKSFLYSGADGKLSDDPMAYYVHIRRYV